MPAIQASRRLVKSPPELWAEVSDAASLARHLGEVGEITITRLEPETTVAWEGERASGTVELAPAGWGTSVTFTAEPVAAEVADEAPEPVAREPEPVAPELAPAPAPEPEPKPAAKPRRSLFQRLFGRRRAAANADRAGGGEDARAPGEDPGCAHPEPTGPARSSAEPEPEPQPDPLEQVLTQALDSLGQAHHRPFSRG
ncbi:MAG: hypothetical protein JSS99_02670 [Actinobacteria bacterium]|nr:hypothetical protein [Actinomycetota bacterium]